MAKTIDITKLAIIAAVAILFIAMASEPATPKNLIDTSKPIKFSGTINGEPAKMTMNLAKQTYTTCIELGGAPYCETLKGVNYEVLENTPEITRIKACYKNCAEFIFKPDKSVTIRALN